VSRTDGWPGQLRHFARPGQNSVCPVARRSGQARRSRFHAKAEPAPPRSRRSRSPTTLPKLQVFSHELRPGDLCRDAAKVDWTVRHAVVLPRGEARRDDPSGSQVTRGRIWHMTEPPRVSRRLQSLRGWGPWRDRAGFLQRYGSARCRWWWSTRRPMHHSGRRSPRSRRSSGARRRRSGGSAKGR
jgi:hypothetical protein